jgi:hypothetical protein
MSTRKWRNPLADASIARKIIAGPEAQRGCARYELSMEIS